MTAELGIKFEDWLAQELKDGAFCEAYQHLKPGFKVARLRMLAGLTQAELAERIGAEPSIIARLEDGEIEPDRALLGRITKRLL